MHFKEDSNLNLYEDIPARTQPFSRTFVTKPRHNYVDANRILMPPSELCPNIDIILTMPTEFCCCIRIV